MRLFPPPLEIAPNEGFNASKDIFGRKQFGDGLTSLLEASTDPLVIALNAKWGTGKSTFLRMWSGALRNAGHPVIYFDAFEHDYLSDAFEALAGEIIDLANSLLQPTESRKIKDTAIAAGKVLIKVGASIGIRAATAGLLSVEHLTNIVDDAKEAVGGTTDKIVESALASRKSQRNTLEAFRIALSELPALLGDENKPLIFIIDELDRCRPPFALEILEKMKHFFAVKGVHFILGVHMRQLEESVSLTYGSGVDANQYLQKFISLTADLDVPSEQRHESSVLKYVNYLVKKMDFRPDDAASVRYCAEIIGELARHHDFKLRTVEKIMSVLAVALAFTTKNHMRAPPILAGLCVLKVVRPELYARAQIGTLSYSDVEMVFDLRQEKSVADEWPPGYFIQWWRFALDDEADDNLVREIGGALSGFHLRDRKSIVRFTANFIIDRFARTNDG